VVKNHPIIGSGLGVYGLALEKIDPKQSVWFYQPVHNIFILILAETGLAGLILFIYAIYLAFKKATPDNKILVLSLICGLFILGILDHWLISLHFGLFFFATVLGLALNKKPGPTLD
jgi:O-antigen ligase